ncbi:MAG: hypothetical protein EOO62_06510 [Hymenobacter sp.]|nr:MAG: hypothetical protein EOO62_06510 [Hymenobacter sp.]
MSYLSAYYAGLLASQATTKPLPPNAFLIATGITDQVISRAIRAMEQDLDTYQLRSKLLALYPLVGASAFTCGFNLLDPRDANDAYRITFVNTVLGGHGPISYTAEGVKPNSTDSIGLTYLFPDQVLSKDSLSMGFYAGSDFEDVNNTYLVMAGVAEADYSNAFYLYANATSADYWSYRAAASTEISVARPGRSAIGLHIITRTTSASSSYYHFGANDTVVATDQVPSTGLPNTSLTIFGLNHPGNQLTNFDGRLCQGFFVGRGLTAADCLNMNTTFARFQTALGR